MTAHEVPGRRRYEFGLRDRLRAAREQAGFTTRTFAERTGISKNSISNYEKDDFLIELKVTEKQCFGSAGCLVTTKASVTYIGVYETDELPSLIDITYKIKGATEPYTATIEMEDGKYSPDVADVETKRKSDTLEAVVTSVETY